MAYLNDFMTRLDLKALPDYIEAHGRVVSYAKGQAIVAEGQLCRLMGVVKSGYFKFTSLTSGGDEVVTGFSFEGEVVFDYVHTFMQQQPSLSTIKAGCDCELKQVSLAEAREYVLSRCPGFIEKASSVLLAEAYQRYDYRPSTGAYTDRGYGWWYPGEPDKLEHTRTAPASNRNRGRDAGRLLYSLGTPGFIASAAHCRAPAPHG